MPRRSSSRRTEVIGGRIPRSRRRIEQYCPRMTTEGQATLDARTIVLVEGVSDQLAVETLAERSGRDLAAERIRVVPMGGATNIGHFLDRFGPAGPHIRLAGLCDEAEAGVFRRGLERAGLGSGLTDSEMESKGFFSSRTKSGFLKMTPITIMDFCPIALRKNLAKI